MPPEPTPRPPRPLWAWVFPVALVFFATFFLGGRIGFWSDDYWHNLRDPVTGALPELTREGLTIDRGFFLRPLFYVIVPPLTTLSWKAQWPAHLAMTLAHGLVVWLLWRLMRTLGLPAFAAAAAALAFMVYPGHFEALFWVSALPTTLATALMLWVMVLYANWARRRGAFAHPWAAAYLAALPFAAFEICSLNEQPAMGVVVLPLIYWLARRGNGEGCEPEAPAVSWVRALLPAFFCGLAMLLYAKWVRDPNPLKPVGARGSPDQFVPWKDLGHRLSYFTDVLWRRMALRNFWRGALEMGWHEIRAAGWAGWMCLVGVVGAGAMWAREWSARCSSDEPGGERSEPRTLIGRVRRWSHAAAAALRSSGPGVLTGLAWFLAGWVPIVMLVTYDPDSRTRYWPVAGLTLAGAVAGGLCRRRPRPAARASVGVVLVAATVVGAVMLIGVQSAFRARWRLDHEQGRQLRALLPEPIPLTYFVPLEIRSTGIISTKSPVFDSHFRSVWEFPWTATKFIESAYQRGDVRCGYWRSWTPAELVKGADETGIHTNIRLGPAFPRIEGSGSRVSWERAAPFVIDSEARVRLVTEIVIVGPDGKETRVAVPQATRPGLSVPIPPLSVRLPRA